MKPEFRSKIKIASLIIGLVCISASLLKAQNKNCFLEDFAPKPAVLPLSETAVKTTDVPTVTVTVTPDTLGAVSKYIFGNAIAAWMGNNTSNTTFVKNTQALNPSLIRFPGGSWGDVFFWNGRPADLPDSIYDGTTGKKNKLSSISGKGEWSTTVDNYYKLRQQVGAQGLITINYAYARYGLSDKPAEQAAHLAADWVRYDKGRTKFWEIGNENAGPWEAGWMIDTNTNKDGQPKIITGQLYGQHFKIFADSMRAAAAEVGAQIYIGAQVLHFDGTTSWNSVDRTWNAGVFKDVGDAADFYVMHNYFGTKATADSYLSVAATEPKKNIDFIRQDIVNKKASPKPVALTEYNINTIDNNSTPVMSNTNGLQEVILFNELLKNNFGLSARWLLATGETGMFYQGSNSSLLWQARPEFYYGYYTQKFTGDHVISAKSSNTNILAYASKFSTGETGITLINRGKTAEVVTIVPSKIGVGDQYYCYSLNGGDNSDFPLTVTVNDVGPTGTQWGPREQLGTIPARAYPVEHQMVLNSPARSVQFILVDAGTNLLFPTETENLREEEWSSGNYPNPFSAHTSIQFRLPSAGLVSLTVHDQTGRKVTTLINEVLPSGAHTADFDGSSLPSGIYFFTLKTGSYSTTQKMILIK